MPIGISTGAAILGAGALGAGASIFGSTMAAGAQTAAANKAISAQQSMFNTAKGLAMPFIQGGQDAWKILAPMLGIGGTPADAKNIYGGAVQPGYGTLTSPFQPTQQFLEQTPGYQFIKQQGLESTQNSFAAKGLGSSGAAMKGAADYVTGIAGNTWQQQFEDYQKQIQSIYGMLYGPTQQGAQSAAAVGGQAIQTGQGVANSLGYMGNAQAAGYNSIGTGVGQFANTAAGYALYGPLINAQTQYYNNANNASTASIAPSVSGAAGGFGGGASPIYMPPNFNYLP